MFDIGFAELLIIGVVGLLVIGPERLPGAIRTGSAWLNRFRRGFNDIKQEVQQELHNDAVLRELRESGEKLRRETESLQRDLTSGATDDGGDGLSAADQSSGHRETPAPFMRSGQSSNTTDRDTDAAGQSDADPTQGAEEAGADGGSDEARESDGHKS